MNCYYNFPDPQIIIFPICGLSMRIEEENFGKDFFETQQLKTNHIICLILPHGGIWNNSKKTACLFDFHME